MVAPRSSFRLSSPTLSLSLSLSLVLPNRLSLCPDDANENESLQTVSASTTVSSGRVLPDVFQGLSADSSTLRRQSLHRQLRSFCHTSIVSYELFAAVDSSHICHSVTRLLSIIQARLVRPLSLGTSLQFGATSVRRSPPIFTLLVLLSKLPANKCCGAKRIFQ
jgi:hypothetical protein